MAKVSFEPVIKWFTGKLGDVIYRRSHNGKVSVYAVPDTSKIEWSRAQKQQRQRMGEAVRYASAAIADPDIRPIYVQMAESNHMNKDCPFDMAVKDYYHTGNDLLWKKHMATSRNRRTGICTVTRGISRNEISPGNRSPADLGVEGNAPLHSIDLNKTRRMLCAPPACIENIHRINLLRLA